MTSGRCDMSYLRNRTSREESKRVAVEPALFAIDPYSAHVSSYSERKIARNFDRTSATEVRPAENVFFFFSFITYFERGVGNGTICSPDKVKPPLHTRVRDAMNI